MIDFIDEAVAFNLSGQARALVTNPIQKETLYPRASAMRGTPIISHILPA